MSSTNPTSSSTDNNTSEDTSTVPTLTPALLPLTSTTLIPPSTPHKLPISGEEVVNPQEHAIWCIQSWYRHLQQVQHSKSRLLHSVTTNQQIDTLARIVTTLTTTSSMNFDTYQHILFSEAWMKSLMTVIHTLPKDPLVKEKHSIMTIVKHISSAILISNFPQDCLAMTEEATTPQTPNTVSYQREIQIKAKECHLAAKLLEKYTYRLIQAILFYIDKSKSSKSSVKSSRKYQFSTIISQYKYCLRSFLSTFQQWKALDSIRMIKGLEDTFIQAYSAYMASQMELFSNHPGSSMELVQAAEFQVLKIREMLLKMLGGNKGVLRLEELCAEVELMYPEYRTLLAQFQQQQEEQANSQQNQASTSTNSSNPTTSNTTTTNLSTNSNSAISEEERKAMRYLEMLSELAGVENERLAHEITLDPHYRIPLRSSPNPYSSAGMNQSSDSNNSEEGPKAVKDTKSFAMLMKRQILLTIGDKLINSLRTSNVQTLEQLEVGMSVPIRITSPARLPSHVRSIPTYTATITKINYEGDEESNEINKQTESDAEKETESVDANSHPNIKGKVVSVDVKYTIEQSTEADVSLDRVKLSSDALDPIPLIEALIDLGQSIARLTPRRPDLQHTIMHSFDPELLSQILVHSKDISAENFDDSKPVESNNSSTDVVVHDIYPIFHRIFTHLQGLQAEVRLQDNENWWGTFSGALLGLGHARIAATSTPSSRDVDLMVSEAKKRSIAFTPKAAGKSKGRLEDVVELIPMYFEKMADLVEDIQRDMANYYISMLVPILQQHGHFFLQQRFVARISQGHATVHRTAQFLSVVLAPVHSAFASTVQDLVEAEVCTNPTLTLQDLVNVPDMNLDIYSGIVAKAMLSLLQTPQRLDSAYSQQHILPETLAWDSARLSSIRDLVDIIALESSIVITSKQILHRYQVAARESEEIELQHRLDVLLSSPSARAPIGVDGQPQGNTDNDDVSIGNIVMEVVKYVQFAIYRTREASLSWMKSTATTDNNTPNSPTPASTLPHNYDVKELHDRVEKSIRDVIQENSPVLTLFTKRVYKVLLRALTDKPYLPKLASYSLQSKGQERKLAKLIESSVKLFKHTMKIHGELYHQLIRNISTAALQEQASSQAQNQN